MKQLLELVKTQRITSVKDFFLRLTPEQLDDLYQAVIELDEYLIYLSVDSNAIMDAYFEKNLVDLSQILCIIAHVENPEIVEIQNMEILRQRFFACVYSHFIYTTYGEGEVEYTLFS